MRLGDIAPRIGRAWVAERDAWELAEAARITGIVMRRVARDELLSAERLVAHRELQLVRAGYSRNGRYIRQRQQKLDEAYRILEAAAARAKELGC